MARTLGMAPSRPPTSQYMCIFIGLVRSVAFSHIIVAESIQAQIPGALKPVIQEAARWYLVARPGLWQVPAGNKRTHRADQTTTLWVRQLVMWDGWISALQVSCPSVVAPVARGLPVSIAVPA